MNEHKSHKKLTDVSSILLSNYNHADPVRVEHAQSLDPISASMSICNQSYVQLDRTRVLTIQAFLDTGPT